jgi:hypothetical protein
LGAGLSCELRIFKKEIFKRGKNIIVRRKDGFTPLEIEIPDRESGLAGVDGAFQRLLKNNSLIDNRSRFFNPLDDLSAICRVRYITIKALLQQGCRLRIA